MTKRRVASRILRYTALVLLALIAGLGVFYSLGARLGNRPVPMPFGVGVSVVLSGSMEGDRPGSLDVGDLIFFTADDGYDVDDVVVYTTGNISVVHRVIVKNGEEIVTKGDANDSPDDPIDVSMIHGKVRFSLPRVGYIALFLKSPLGILITVCAAVVLVEWSNVAERKRKNAETEKIRAEIERLKNDVK